ncbi:MAG: alpha/beta hydrolase [Propionibacteriaceae bacterium]|jgi:pimeloyl-ACP methyl ester carboxylesterase|nr:alpha/beta hydrolase [Propionibacteriaceae bacterium]
MKTMHSPEYAPILLIPGYWLGAWAWDGVTARLTELGHQAEAVTLPGLESLNTPRESVRFADHVAYVTDRIVALGGRVGLVAHSGAGAIATVVADRMPEALVRLVYVDSGPVADGTVPRPDVTETDVELPFPGLDALAAAGVSSEGLTDADRTRLAERAVPHPAGAVRQAVVLRDRRRNNVPTTMVCCSASSDAVRELAAAGAPMFAPLNDLTKVTLVDLATGHWPMFSRPTELADLIATEMIRAG